MTLHITITNEPDANSGRNVNVRVCEELAGDRVIVLDAESCELAPGESRTITLYGSRFVNVLEQHIGE